LVNVTRATLKDVAREAGLSVTQVSRALNDHDDVASATKEHARNVAAALNYAPNLDARRLQDPRMRTGAIGLVLPPKTLLFSDPFFGDLLSSLVTEAGAHGMQLQLSTPPGEADVLAPYDEAIRQKRVDGFVLVRTLVDDPRVTFLLERSFPFVSFGRPESSNGFTSVDASHNSFDGVISHLTDLGHRHIACLAEPPQFAIAAHRLESFRSAITPYVKADVFSDPSVLVAGFHSIDGFDVALKLLSESNPPTAVVALNDLLALGTLQAAEELGLRVPDDLSVVGFDDIAAAQLVTPNLTTIHQSSVEIGAMLIRELIPLMDRQSNSEKERLIEPELVIRASTGVARRRS